MANSIDTSLLLSNYQQSQNKTGSSTLGKDDFLKLLMTQLQNQDPTNPLQDTEFIAQMAQFSSIEQLTNLNSSFQAFMDQQQQGQLISYNQFIGKDITWHKLNDLGDGVSEIEEGTGKVSSIQFKDNNVLFILEDGTKLEPSNISQVNETSSESHILQASMMIGKKVSYYNNQNEEVSSIVNSVSFKGGQTILQLNDEKTISPSQITKIE